MHKQRMGSSLIFWLSVLCLALGPTASAVDDEAPALETPALESPAAPPSNAASLIPANTPPTLKALGGAVRPGGHLVLAAYATDADSSLVQVLAALHLRPGQPAPAWLGQTRWASPLAPFPLLEIAVSPPADAVPETYVIEVSATDDGGLSALGEMLLEVLPPETPAVPPPAPSPAGAQGASSSSAAAVGGASSGTAGAAAAKAATSSSSESPSLSLSVSPASVAEGSIRDIVVTGTLMGVSMVPGVDVTGVLQVSGTATDGTDYSLSGTKSLVIPAGSATLTGTRTLRLSALGDVRERESDETVKFKVTQVTRGTEVLALSSTAKTSVTITNVYAKPPKVSGVAAEATSDSSLKVTWEAPEASPAVTEYVVQYRRDDKPNKDWTRVPRVSGGVLEALVTGLHSGRRYDVRVRARNEARNGQGKGDWSDEATANTAPKVTLEAADGGVASIREGNASVGVALTGRAKAQGGGGTLTGQWLRVTGSGSSETETAWGSSFTMASRRDYEKTARSDAPGTRKYRLRVTHDLSGERATVDRDATVTWLPKVLLSASPSSVPEDGGARTVTVEAKLTGRTVSSSSKSVRVNVKGDTATEGTDFAAVSDFTISIPGGDRSATGTFELSPVADSASEGGETVKLKGSATEGDQELKARNGEVTIEDEQVTLTVSPTPTNGSVTGTGIACGTGTAGDCSESVTKSTPLTLAASPASGWVFRKWSGACSEDEDASCALTVSGATTVGASFRRPKVKVEVSPAAGGSVTGTGISCGAGTTNDCSERVSTGSIALTAAPASGYAVSSWSGGNCSGKGTTCTATVTEDVTVTVTFAEGSVPAAPSGLSAAPGDGSVALSWTDPGDASITGYEIRRKAGSGAYGSWSDISGSGANTTSHSVTGLTNGTAYSFELRAENASGAGAGAEVSATPKAIPGLVTDLTATATGAATASLSWTAPASGGAVDSYTVTGSGTIAVSGTSATITGLLQDTDYSWTVKAANGSGSSAAVTSNTIRIPYAPGVVTGVMAMATGAATASLSWTAPSATASTGAATSYIVAGPGTISAVVATSGISYVVSGAGMLSVTGTTVTITGLSQDTDHSWTVKAQNAGGISAAVTSNTIRIPYAPGPVTGVTAMATGASTASLGWTAPSATATTGAVASYVVAGDGTISVSGTSATVTGLSRDTDYSWTVKAKNVGGESAAVSSDTIRIPHPPGPVTGLSASANSGSSATLSWTAPAITATQGEAASYTVSRGGAIIVSVTETSATLTGLTAGSTYDWTVKAVNVSGSSSAASISLAMPTPVTLTVARSLEAGGSVTGAKSGSSDKIIDCGTDCEETVYSGDEVQLTATASSGHRFTGWTGCDSASGAVCTQTVGGAETVTANFVQRFALTVSKSLSAGGSVSGSTVSDDGTVLTSGVIDCGGDCTETVDSGTKVELTATASSGHRFTGWTGCDSASGAVCTQTVGGAETVTANFVQRFALTVSKSLSAGGSVSGSTVSDDGTVLTSGVIDCGGDCTETVDSGTKVELTATASSGHRFTGWTGCDSASGAVCTQTVGGAETVTANFVQRFALTVSKSLSAGGSVSGSTVSDDGTVLTSGVIDCGGDCTETVDSGTKVELTATASSGHRFTGWTGCDSASGAVCTQTVGGAEMVTANFGLIPRDLTVGRASHGYVSGHGVSCGSGKRAACTATLPHGTGVTLEATPDDNYELTGWSGCPGTFSKAGSTCSFDIVADTSVPAPSFGLIPRDLTVGRASHGYVSGHGVSCGSGKRAACTATLPHGTGVTLEATPDDNYELTGWSGCPGTFSKAGSTCSFDIVADTSVPAPSFGLIPRDLTVGRASHGYVSGHGVSCGSGKRAACTATLPHGTGVTLEATPDDNYELTGWSGCPGTFSKAGSTCSFDIVADTSVPAPSFGLIPRDLTVGRASHGYVSGHGVSCGSGKRAACAATLPHGTGVTLEATPDDNYELTGWSGCPGTFSKAGSTCSFDIVADTSVPAPSFGLIPRDLTVGRASHGYVSGHGVSCGSGKRAACAATLPHGTGVTLEATPDDNYELTGWSGCPGTFSKAGSTCSFDIVADTSVPAPSFGLIPRDLTVGRASHGYVSGHGVSCGSGKRAACAATLPHGTGVTLEATPDDNYELTGWSGCPGTFSKAGSTCSFDIVADTSVPAPSFDKEKYKLEIKPKPTGGYIEDNNDDDVDINCGFGTSQTDCVDNEVEHGTNVSLTAHRKAGYKFDKWTGKCAGQTTSTCTFRMVALATTGATFKKEYTLTVTSSSKGYVTWSTGKNEHINCGSGTGRTNCTETVLHDTSIPLAATPNTGYRLKDWTCSPSSSPCPPAKMTGNLTVTPNFKTTLTVDAGGPYQGTKVPGRRFYSVTVRATASGGASPYSYTWEDKSANSRSATYLFPHPNGARLYGRNVTVTDANGETATKTATITIIPSMSGFSDEFAYAVPLGGALSLVWGGGGSVAATSGDVGIAGVSVNGAEIIVSGVSAGRTEISVRAGQEAFRVPVRIGGG